MATLTDMIGQLRSFDLERRLGLRAPLPRVAVELDRGAMTLVRLRAKRRGRPQLESFRVQTTEDGELPATLVEQEALDVERLAERLRRLFEMAGVRPGRVSLVLPDNLARLSIVGLPERPPSRRQLEEVLRFHTRRAVPFRGADATMAYQVLAGEGRGVQVLVALMRRGLVERFEQAIEAVGARAGLVDLCTPNLLNLCRERIEAASHEGDVAFLNCTSSYFSLAIVREGRLAFLRCKTYAMGNGHPTPAAGLLGRELGYSLSYYEEKIGGKGIRTLLVRCVADPYEALAGDLASLGAERIEPIDPLATLEGTHLEAATAQRLAPALGAALGRG